MIKRSLTTKAFTLIELLVVISIIGMLSSVVLVSVNSARAKGVDTSRVQAVTQVRNALELYASNNGGKYPFSTGNGTPNYETLEQLVLSGGPLNQYLKSLPAKISSESATKYISDGDTYQLFVTSETGGQFTKNNGCDSTQYTGYEAENGTQNNAYCIGNAAGVAGGGGGNTNSSVDPPTNVVVSIVGGSYSGNVVLDQEFEYEIFSIKNGTYSSSAYGTGVIREGDLNPDSAPSEQSFGFTVTWDDVSGVNQYLVCEFGSVSGGKYIFTSSNSVEDNGSLGGGWTYGYPDIGDLCLH